jgi:hypothetical protein
LLPFYIDYEGKNDILSKYTVTISMSSVLHALWRPPSPRKTLQRRDKAFRAQPKSFGLNASKKSVPSLASEAAYSTSTGEEEDTEMDVEDDTEESTSGSQAIVGPEQEDTEDDQEDEEGSTYDANQALEVVKTDKMLDFLARKFEDQTISSRDEKVGIEEAKVNQKRVEGWAEDTLELCLRMETRGLYPMFPIEWQRDFPFMGDHLFSADDDEAYLSPRARLGKNSLLFLQDLSNY